MTLRATLLAFSTLGIAKDPAQLPVRPATTAPAPARRRSGNKQDTVIAMLQAENDATTDEIVAATLWAAQTARCFMLNALKKTLGLPVLSEKAERRGQACMILRE